MKGLIKYAAGLAAGISLVACGQKSAETPAAVVTPLAPTLIETMNTTIIPGSNLIWQMAGDLYDDDGNLDANRLTNPQWTQLAGLAAAMSVAAKTLAETPSLKVVPMGGRIQGEGTEGAPSAAQVQKAIDADPKGFSEHAMQLVAVADEIQEAAGTHDAAKVDDAQARMTDVCGDCHAAYWYPEQAGQ